MWSYLLCLTLVGPSVWACEDASSDHGGPVGLVTGEVVYGEDDRTDVYEYPDQAWVEEVLEHTVALTYKSFINASNPNDVRLPQATLQEQYDLCDGERFLDQPAVSWCSGVLVAEDAVVTTGHCIEDQQECLDTSVIFNYAMADSENLRTITADDVYSCVELLVQEFTELMDYAIIKLDRPVVGRRPATIRRERTALEQDAPLIMVGSPSSLPIKIDDGGRVRDNRDGKLDYFTANLDAFAGSSGSGVYLAETKELAGVLARGNEDYEDLGSCSAVLMCDDTGCEGEAATYAFRAVDGLCSTVSSSALCPCGNGTCDDDESSATCWADCGSACDDGACNGDEDPVNCPQDCGVCGNGTCEDVEASEGSCCTDCGCPGEELCVKDACIPNPGPGNSCADPEPLGDRETQVVEGSTVNATANSLGGACGGRGPDRVYTFTIDGNRNLLAEVEGTDGYDTVLYLRTDCEDADTMVTCNDDRDTEGDRGSRIDATKLPAGTYFLFVDSRHSSGGDYTLTVTITEHTICEDADGDGTCDTDDGCPEDPDKTEPGQCGCGKPEGDGDGDGTCDADDGCPDDPEKTEPGDCGCATPDSDDDDDGVLDCDDGCPDDPEKTEPGDCGCGTPDSDGDDDGVADCDDECPEDKDKTEPGECDCGSPDSDGDDDGVADCNDECPEDKDKTQPGDCGCGNPESDDCDESTSGSDEEPNSGCGCRLMPQPGNPVGLAPFALILLVGVLRRRRRCGGA